MLSLDFRHYGNIKAFNPAEVSAEVLMFVLKC